LREALKAELQKGQMKAVKGFVKTCYSETLLLGQPTPENEHENSSMSPKDDPSSDDSEITYHNGLGLRFKFPGDPKKLAHL
jgi:TBC1 domain family member 8/9